MQNNTFLYCGQKTNLGDAGGRSILSVWGIDKLGLGKTYSMASYIYSVEGHCELVLPMKVTTASVIVIYSPESKSQSA